MNLQSNSSRHHAGILIGLQIAILLSALDQTVLNIAIPKLAADLHGSHKSAWIITSYLLFSTVATPISGKLSDIFGAKIVLIAAIAFFTVASGLCGSAGLVRNLFGLDGMDQMIFFRALQGISGGAVLGLCFISIGDLFPVRERGKYQGFLAAAFIVAAIVGPALGGWLTDAYSWRLIFYMNIPLGVIAAGFVGACFPLSLRQRARAIIDYAGMLLLILCIVPLILGAASIGRLGYIDGASMADIIFSAILLVAFIWRERTAKEPLLPLQLFRDRLISISLATVFITGIGLFGSMLLLAMLLQRVIGMTATISGVALSPLMLVVACASIAGGFLIAKTGRYKALIILALSALCLGSLMLSRLTATSPIWLFMMQSAVGGIGLGLLLPVHTIIIQNVVPGKVMGVATSMTQFFRSLGGTIGTGVLSALMLSLIRHGSLQEAISQVLLIYAFAVAVAIFLNFFLPELVLKKVQAQSPSS